MIESSVSVTDSSVLVIDSFVPVIASPVAVTDSSVSVIETFVAVTDSSNSVIESPVAVTDSSVSVKQVLSEPESFLPEFETFVSPFVTLKIKIKSNHYI